MTAIPTPPPLTPADQTAPWEEMLEIFYAPSRVFRRRMGDTRFLVPFLVVVLGVALIMYAGWPIVENAAHADSLRAIERYIASHPQLPADAVDKMRQGAQTGGNGARYFAGPGVALVIGLLGLFVWLSGKIVGAKTTMEQAYMISAYAYLPKLLGALAMIVLALVLPDSMLNTQWHLTLGAGLALNPDTTSLKMAALLARVDLWTLWVTFLIALGLKITGGLSTARATVAGVVIWLIGAIVPLAGALVAG